MDSITRKVREMYSRFPYPSPSAGRAGHMELANLLRLFCHETGVDLAGASVLDAGTGSGHRLVEAAALFPDTTFLGLDVSEGALEVARETARSASLDNVSFRTADLMQGLPDAGRFDLVLCMGVLHHTAEPPRVLRNLVAGLAPDGFLFLYVYGSRGARERLRRKAVVSLLLGGETGDFERGIALVRDLGFGLEEYGWKADGADAGTEDALIVDSYLNVNEVLFDLPGLADLLRDSGLRGFVPYGITTGNAGLLFDVFPGRPTRMMTRSTDFRSLLATDATRGAFEELDLAARYRLADLVYEPNGYTVLGLGADAPGRLESAPRLVDNTWSFR